MDDFLPIAAERVSLVEIPIEILGSLRSDPARVARAATAIDRAGTLREIHYPKDFAGDAVGMFANHLARRVSGQPKVAILGAIVDRELGIAVGNMGTHGLPAGGRVEVGYSIAAAFERSGYATEMLRSFTEALLARGDVSEVVAETLADNVASMRVLEKAGYVRSGSRNDAEALLVTWTTRSA